MPTNKTPFTFHLDDETLLKIKEIAKSDTRSTSNLIEHLCRTCVIEYEAKNGQVRVRQDD